MQEITFSKRIHVCVCMYRCCVWGGGGKGWGLSVLGRSWVSVPPEAANFSLKNDCFERVELVLCCFVFLLCCVALPCLSEHLTDD